MSTDQSRNGCGMCCFCHAQPFEITRAKNIKNPLVQRSCQNAEVVEAFCSRRVHHRDRHQHTIPIALAALPGAILPATSCLGAFWTPASSVCRASRRCRRLKTRTLTDSRTAAKHLALVDASGLIIPFIPFGLERQHCGYRKCREGSPGSDAGSCPRRAPPDGLVRLH